VMIISTPINTHAALAEQSMRAGSHVYLEKPPVESLTSFTHLVSVAEELRRSVQVGFQAAGSEVLPRIRHLMASGAIGRVELITAVGCWSRDRAYYDRSPWAGRRRMGDVVVADGVVTNPLAHSVAAALQLAQTELITDLHAVTTELYRAHDIESDDTSWIGIESSGVPVSCALTVASGSDDPPLVTVYGERGSLTFDYRSDILTTTIDGATTTETLGRIDTVENVLDHLTSGVPLLSPLARTGAFMCVLQAIQEAPPPTPIDGAYVTWRGTGVDAYPMINNIHALVAGATRRPDGGPGAGYLAAGAPWATADARTRWQPLRD
ncbi:MAG: Gfo/Idh/MocA family oxidoreductase, partial [Propionibacteriales bacterium]|nr:Gfo/Idh/MocA family oxidoreductase [Propionibacteriales bacterium]